MSNQTVPQQPRPSPDALAASTFEKRESELDAALRRLEEAKRIKVRARGLA